MNSGQHNDAPQDCPSRRRHILTVALEDYFQVGAFNTVIQHGQWYRFETRFERNTLKVLDLLDRFDIKATFFVLGWIAEKRPEIVKEVAGRGHEIANRGYYHRSIQQMSRAEFRDDLRRSQEALERASGHKVIGYRSAHQAMRPADVWALEVLADEGYAYDSSIMPMFRDFRAEPFRRFAHQCGFRDKHLWEFPLSTTRILGWQIPIAGGNYLRQFPHALVKRSVEHWDLKYDSPFVMYFHVWEIDPEQARINAASQLARLRHYRNLDKMAERLEYYFSRYQFIGAAKYLGIDTTTANPRAAKQLPQAVSCIRSDAGTRGKLPITLVVPCFNEEMVLPYLNNTLESVDAALAKDYEPAFIFVDDNSADGTFAALHKLFGNRKGCSIIRQAVNRGVAAAIMTGIQAAATEVVCSLDCDCTYDPHQLLDMLPRLAAHVDLVTASPYHPLGKALNVPRWRLSLSKGASFLYRLVLGTQLHTYTSCFRIYRRSAVIGVRLHRNGFLGIAELLAVLSLRKAVIVEHPAVLEVRMLGRSKMKTLRTIVGHLGLLARLLWMRAAG